MDSFLDQAGGIGVPETYTKDFTDRYAYRVNYRGILSQNTLLVASGGRYRRTNKSVPLSGDLAEPNYYWMDIALSTNNAGWDYEDSEWRTEFSIGATQYLDLGGWGDHELGAGWGFYSNALDASARWTGTGFDLWPGDGFDNGVQVTWAEPGLPMRAQEDGPTITNNATRGFHAYIQDSFTLGRFSFMLGLRTETQHGPQ